MASCSLHPQTKYTQSTPKSLHPCTAQAHMSSMCLLLAPIQFVLTATLHASAVNSSHFTGDQDSNCTETGAARVVFLQTKRQHRTHPSALCREASWAVGALEAWGYGAAILPTIQGPLCVCAPRHPRILWTSTQQVESSPNSELRRRGSRTHLSAPHLTSTEVLTEHFQNK